MKPQATAAARRCCASVPVPGMNTLRFRQCSRKAVTEDGNGLPVCAQHSPAGVVARAQRAEQAFARKRARIRAEIHASAAIARAKREKGA